MIHKAILSILKSKGKYLDSGDWWITGFRVAKFLNSFVIKDSEMNVCHLLSDEGLRSLLTTIPKST